MGTGSFPGVESGRGVTLTPHPLLVPRSKNRSIAIPLLSPVAFVGCKNCVAYLPRYAEELCKGGIKVFFLQRLTGETQT
jgi:hypothetical protein